LIDAHSFKDDFVFVCALFHGEKHQQQLRFGVKPNREEKATVFSKN
jgi:hypothetical protein